MALNQNNNFRVTTPHAAVIVWNYNDRLGVDPSDGSTINEVNQTILSTVSCVSIQTSKSKGSPAGTFNIVLAPNRDWVSQITAGSWCAILMSNEPITQAQIAKADPKFVKMIGKIDTVRVDVDVNDEAARQTRYIVSGTDWGYIFNNVLYIDNLIDPNNPDNQNNALAIALQAQLFGEGNTPQSFKTADNLVMLLNIFGTSSTGLEKASSAINRLNKSIYDFLIPNEMARYFGFIDGDGNVNSSTKISDLLTLQTGRLTSYDTYEETNEAFGYLDPFSLQGTNTFWQILMDNSNMVLNEMYNEIEWETSSSGTVGPSLTIFNRIKPFAYLTDPPDDADQVEAIRSPFTLLRTHIIDNVKVTKINVGTNWRDKYNFVEIRPQFQDFNIIANWTAQKSQGSDSVAFQREGFRPLILGTKQFPVDPSDSKGTYNPDLLTSWISLLKEWYFDTHRLLNGTLIMRGSTEYIAVGNNILFEAGLINPTMNLNQGANVNPNINYILAHVENVEHSFTVSDDGARTYVTTIQFVRGIVVNNSGGNYTLVGNGSLDQLASSLQNANYKNTVNSFGTSDGINDPAHPIDPDPAKLRGY